MTIKYKLLLILTEIAATPLVLMGVIGYTNLHYQIQNNTLNSLSSIAQIQKNRLDNIYIANTAILKALINHRELVNDLNAYQNNPTVATKLKLSQHLDDIKSTLPEINNVILASKSGQLILSTTPEKNTDDLSHEPFFSRSLNENTFSLLKANQLNAQNAIYVAGPIKEKNQTIGIAVIIINSSEIYNITNDYTGLGNTGETLIVESDAQGNALYLSPTRFNPEAAFKLTMPKTNVLADSIHAISGTESAYNNLVDYRGQSVLAATRYSSNLGWGIVSKIDISEALYSETQLQTEFGAIIAVSILVILLFSLLLANSFSDPINLLDAFAHKIANGDFTGSLAVHTGDEFGRLANSLLKMEQSLKNLYVNLDVQVKTKTAILTSKVAELENSKKAMINVMEDLSEEKASTAALAADMKKFQLAVENASDHIIITDPEGYILYVNRAAEQITGFPRREILGTKAGKLWGNRMPKDFYEQMWHTIKTEKRTFEGQISNHRKNGQDYVAQSSISPILNNKGEIIFFVAIERDITKAIEVDKMKTEFISLASHQMRTPLGATKWFVELLLDPATGPLTDEQRTYLVDISKSNERMIELVNSLLDISRIESGRLTIEPVPTKLSDLVNDVAKDFDHQISELKFELKINAEENLPSINIDPKLISQVLSNLISNAVKYSTEGDKITINIKTEGENQLIEVIDTGLGIPEGQQHRVFDRFFRADNIMRTVPTGTGLGLYLAKTIVEASGGKIGFESEENVGSRFWFTLPQSGSISHKGEIKLGGKI